MRRTFAGTLLLGLLLVSPSEAEGTVFFVRPENPYANGMLDRFVELEGLGEPVLGLSGGTLPIREMLDEIERGSGVWFQVEGAKRECDGGWISGLTLGEILLEVTGRCNLFLEVRSPHQVFVYVPEGDAFESGGTEVIDGARAYPDRARELDVEGTVAFRVLVNPKGIVSALEMRRESPAGYGFAAAAEPIVRNHTFTPRERDGAPVETTFTVFADFSKYQLRRLRSDAPL